MCRCRKVDPRPYCSKQVNPNELTVGQLQKAFFLTGCKPMQNTRIIWFRVFLYFSDPSTYISRRLWLAAVFGATPGAKPDSDALLRYWRSARKGFPVTMFGDNFDRYLIGQLPGHFQGAIFYSVAHQYNTISYFQNIFNIQTIFLMQHFRANIEHHFFATFSFVDIFKTLPRCNICKPNRC